MWSLAGFSFLDLSVRTDRQGKIDSAIDPSICYILSEESNTPFYSTSNGYKL